MSHFNIFKNSWYYLKSTSCWGDFFIFNPFFNHLNLYEYFLFSDQKKMITLIQTINGHRPKQLQAFQVTAEILKRQYKLFFNPLKRLWEHINPIKLSRRKKKKKITITWHKQHKQQILSDSHFTLSTGSVEDMWLTYSRLIETRKISPR
jgi:hypothetical protein